MSLFKAHVDLSFNSTQGFRYQIVCALQVNSEGQKFGKSEGGVIWLSAEKLSPYKFYQYLYSTTDADVFRFLRILTFLPTEEIDALEEAQRGAPQSGYVANTAQRKLAEEVTLFVHGEQGLEQAQKATAVSAEPQLLSS